MSKRAKILLWGLALGLVALSLGQAIRVAEARGVFSRWESLGAPSSKITELLSTTRRGVYVLDRSGTILFCDTSAQSSDCWSEVGEVSDDESRDENLPCPPPQQFWVRSPSSEIVEIEDHIRCTPHSTILTKYALTSSGEVLTWQASSVSTPIFDISLCFPIGALLLGVFLGLAIGVARHVPLEENGDET